MTDLSASTYTNLAQLSAPYLLISALSRRVYSATFGDFPLLIPTCLFVFKPQATPLLPDHLFAPTLAPVLSPLLFHQLLSISKILIKDLLLFH